MSLILDALKKAETERRQAQPARPVTSVAAEEPPRFRRRWLIGFLAMALVANGLLLIWWLQPWARPGSPVVAARVESLPVPGDRPAEAAPVIPPVVEPAAAHPVASPQPEAPSAPVPSPASLPERAEPNGVPAFRELSPVDRARLPEIDLQLHFFTENAERRLVRINGANLHQGDGVGGVRVMEIHPAAVTLEVGGVKFSLPAGRP